MDILHKKDKEETKKKLIAATGEIFMTKGYSALKASRIAYVAGVSKTLIYRYFGNVQELFKVYLSQKDFWISLEDHVDALLEANRHDSGRELAKSILESQIAYFFQNKEMQQIMRWQISEPNVIARSLADSRERLGEEMLGISDPHFKDSGVNFRALLAVIVPGIYYLVLNAKVNGSTFCGIDINKSEDIKEVQKAVNLMVDWAYEKAGS
ncbi:TetR/AcrR family transcriptional regulator [Dyadobacter subterraneus]|uniref:TetR/AcrR family transcriptional regulator n=1 Tax=Dyadobacter subterraneus TaxID=2773304 RepID=A0ABR9W884_9BACT|nr:TetR/AcrR family transcriptional regulator [Dyadobacter subterraneus]MBE9461685.1 TetR/AcrR family transcriptional regulator [Dyadobacter subterraneus]